MLCRSISMNGIERFRSTDQPIAGPVPGRTGRGAHAQRLTEGAAEQAPRLFVWSEPSGNYVLDEIAQEI
jgi:hypothetical protein